MTKSSRDVKAGNEGARVELIAIEFNLVTILVRRRRRVHTASFMTLRSDLRQRVNHSDSCCFTRRIN